MYLFQYMSKRMFLRLFDVQTIAAVVGKDVSIIGLHVIYDANVITAVRKQTYVCCKIIVKRKFLRASHVVSSNPFPNKCTWHVQCLFVSHCTLNHFNKIFNATINHGSHDWQNPSHTQDQKRPVMTEALHKVADS